MTHPKKRKPWMLLSLAMVAVGGLIYVSISPTPQVTVKGEKTVDTAVYNTVYNDTERVLKVVRIRVGKRVYDIGPLLPGGVLPFHLQPQGATEYVLEGSFDLDRHITKTVAIGTPPYPKAALHVSADRINISWNP